MPAMLHMNKHHFHIHTVYVKYILLCLSKNAMPHGVCNHTFAQMHKQQKKDISAWPGEVSLIIELTHVLTLLMCTFSL